MALFVMRLWGTVAAGYGPCTQYDSSIVYLLGLIVRIQPASFFDYTYFQITPYTFASHAAVEILGQVPYYCLLR